MCRFLSPARFSCVTSASTSKTFDPAGIGSAGQSMTTSRHECCGADAGVVQSHSTMAGAVGDSEEIVFAAPIGTHALALAALFGNAVQKSAGSGGRPAAAGANSSFTVTL